LDKGCRKVKSSLTLRVSQTRLSSGEAAAVEGMRFRATGAARTIRSAGDKADARRNATVRLEMLRR
jgi:hypothetical protein